MATLKSILGPPGRWAVVSANTTMDTGVSYSAVNTNPPSNDDPLWSNVAALLSFEGVNGSTAIVDDASNGWTATGGFTISTARARFGTASGAFGAANAVLSTPSAVRFDMPGDFCIEFWFWRQSGLGASNVIGRGGGSVASEWIIYTAADGSMRFYTANADVVSTGVLPVDAWSAVRFNRTGTTVASYLNGTRVQTATRSNNFTNTNAIATSFNSGGPNGANMDELRLTIGNARDTGATYTVTTSPFPRPGAASPVEFSLPTAILPGDPFELYAAVGSSRVIPGAGRQIGTAGVGVNVNLSAGQTLRLVARTPTQLDIVA